jgi:cytochrome c553
MKGWNSIIGLVAALAMPLLATAAASAQRDYQDAARAKPDLQHGAQLFTRCAACHGVDGGGEVNGNAPRLAGQLPQVLIRQLVDYRHASRRDPLMESVADGHLLRTAQDTADVAAFAAALRPRAAAAAGPGNSLEQGAALYAARCRNCHGAAGQGVGDAPVPRLAGQHYAYLLRQFHDALDGRRPQLAGSHDPLLRDLDRDGLQGLADALSRMGGRL